jgi:hypothetical protein
MADARAEYGEEIVFTVSRQLIRQFGEGCGRRNLFNMVRFFEVFSHSNMLQTICKIELESAKSSIRVASSMTELPPRKLLEKKLHEAIRLVRARHH